MGKAVDVILVVMFLLALHHPGWAEKQYGSLQVAGQRSPAAIIEVKPDDLGVDKSAEPKIDLWAPNLCLYGSYAFLSFSENTGTTYNYNLAVFGLGLEYNSAIAESALGAVGFNCGLNYNFESTLTYSGVSGSAKLGLHAVYANLVVNQHKSENLSINFGAGLNLSNWSISGLNGTLGGQSYFEFIVPARANLYDVKIGYEILNANEPAGYAASNGLFIRGGAAYIL